MRSLHQFRIVFVSLLVALFLLICTWLAFPQDNRQLQRDATRTTSSERRTALVIGNGAYTNAPPLKNPPNDATLVATTLKNLGFEVTVATNRSQREMKQMIREFGQKLRAGGGVGLFYFAGHGVQAKGRNYLVPIDAEIQTEVDLEDVAVDVNYILSMMDDAQNALNIVILDACRNNPFVRSFRSAQDGLAQVKAPTGTLIAYATSPDSTAADGGGTNSPYSEELTRQMEASGVLLETMFRRVTEQVSFRTGGRQEPWYSNNAKGEFFFKLSTTSGSTNSNLSDPQAAKIDAVTVEREYWETIRSSNDTQDYKDYLKSYPNGSYAVVASARIKQLETAKAAQAPNSQPTNTQPTNSGGNPANESKGAVYTGASKSFKSQQGIEMVYIPAGRLKMGSANGSSDEKPVHEVTISHAFYIGRYEVTQEQWQVVMGGNPSYFKNCGSNCPVERVSWNDVQDFINKLNEANDGYTYRLPTEAEWEYACRGTTAEYYSYRNVDDIGWHTNNSEGKTHAVGGKQPNPFGLYDMLGNVSEWCQDWYEGLYYTHSPATDPQGPSSGQYRISRGGSWNITAGGLRSAFRYNHYYPDYRHSSVGFRVVATLRIQ